MMIDDVFFNCANLQKIAVIENETQVSYGDIFLKIQQLQSLLLQLQLKQAAIFLPNSSAYIGAFLGTIASGMTAFPLSTVLTKYELVPLLTKTSTTLVITAEQFRPVFREIQQSDIPALRVIYMEQLPATEKLQHPAVIERSSGEPMVFLSTSGTTGKAKIVQLSEKNIETVVFGYLEKMGYTGAVAGEIKCVIATPFSTAYGIMVLFACLLKAIPIVLLKEPFTLEAFFKTVEKYGVTNCEGGSLLVTLMEQMAGRFNPCDISALQYIGFGGSKVSGKAVEKLMASYPGVGFYQGYGMTEAAPLITKHKRAKLEKTDSVGTAIKGVQICIEVDGKKTDAPNTEGEILVKGPNIMIGYYGDEEGTGKVIKNRYLHTGDIGYLDREGYLYIRGRKKNIIIVRGFNVYPEEIEECILNSGLVKDCVVYGVRDQRGNEILCADVVPLHPQVQLRDIRAHCQSHLAGYKQPHRLYIRDTIEKTPVGKTVRAGGGHP